MSKNTNEWPKWSIETTSHADIDSISIQNRIKVNVDTTKTIFDSREFIDVRTQFDENHRILLQFYDDYKVNACSVFIALQSISIFYLRLLNDG